MYPYIILVIIFFFVLTLLSSYDYVYLSLLNEKILFIIDIFIYVCILLGIFYIFVLNKYVCQR